MCSTHRNNVEKCSSHFIRVTVLEELVLEHIKLVLQYVAYHEDAVNTEEMLRIHKTVCGVVAFPEVPCAITQDLRS
mgnify:CR=1 FL=1